MIHDDDINCQHNHIKDKNIYKENSYLSCQEKWELLYMLSNM